MIRKLLAAVILLFLVNHCIYASEITSKFYNAVSSGNSLEVKKAIERYFGRGLETNNLNYALFLALEKDQFEVLELLLQNNANVNAVGKNGTPLIIHAAMSRAIEPQKFKALKIVLTYGADINAIDQKYGRTALFITGIVPLYDRMKYLVEQGADINIQEKSGDTALHRMIQVKNELEYIEYLLLHKADPNTINQFGESPLGSAVSTNRFDLVRTLINNNADPNLGDDIHKPLRSAYVNKRIDIAKYLLQKGADPDARNSYGGTSVIGAALSGKEDWVRMLINYRTNINLQDNTGYTALMGACRNGYTSICTYLLTQGADCKLTNKNSETVLDIVKQQNRPDILALLLQHKSCQ